MAVIDDLPIELYKLIFSNYLSINDLFNCRLVNKKFKSITYECVNELVIDESNQFDYDYYWFHNNETIYDDHVVSSRRFREIRSRSIFNLDKSLKYLKINLINDIYHFYFNCNYEEFFKVFTILNVFSNLECLDIDRGKSYDEYDFKLNLNLKKLKYFKLNVDYLEYMGELNTPKLEKIEFFYNLQISIKSNPESIKHLITEDYEDELKKFKNLEIIEFRSVGNLNENLLSFFINLKQLKIEFGVLNESLKYSLIKIFKKSKELNRDIDIYVFGVKIVNEHKLEEYQSCENILQFQLNNYDLLDSFLPTVKKLNYFELNNHYDNLRNDLPTSFFNKFRNISDLDVPKNGNNKPIDLDNLNWFLNNFKLLHKLGIDNSKYKISDKCNFPKIQLEYRVKKN